MMHFRSNDIVSGILHFIGIGLSITALVLLVVFAAMYGSASKVTTFTIFGAGLILLYTASTIYHLLPKKFEKTKHIFRRLDHIMIFILIAASYTPICIIGLSGAWGWSMFGVIWGLALIGIILKATWVKLPNWLIPVIYVLMGWVIVIAIVPLTQALSSMALFWLVLGGVLYTLGAICFGIDRIKPVKHFGFHEIFHLFVIAGSFSHFWMMLKYLI